MTEKEIFEKNLELSSEFSRFIIAHPEIGNKIPVNSEIVFLLDSNPSLTEYNIKMAKKIKEEGRTVVFVHAKSLLPKDASRLVEPRIELALK